MRFSYTYKDKLFLIHEGYEKLTKTISTILSVGFAETPQLFSAILNRHQFLKSLECTSFMKDIFG